MKILGIGNAIVDVLCKVDDDFLVKNSLTKSTMKLIDEDEFKTLLSLLVKIDNYFLVIILFFLLGLQILQISHSSP
jgi:hypothetical protein